MRSQQLDFDGGEVNADAQARATTKGDQRIGRSFILLPWWGKAIGVEYLRVVKDSGQVMAGSQSQTHRRACRQGANARPL